MLYLILAFFVIWDVTADSDVTTIQLDVHQGSAFVLNKTAEELSLARKAGKKAEEDLLNIRDLYYLAEINLGTPPQKVNITFDTGSGSLWVSSPKLCSRAAEEDYCKDHSTYDPKKSKTAVNTGMPYFQGYVTGYIGGVVVKDRLNVGGLILKSQEFGNANQLAEFLQGYRFSGIFGLSFLTNNGIGSPFIKMVKKKIVREAIFSFYFARSDSDIKAEVTLGGIDSTRFKGNFTFARIVTEDRWFIQLDKVKICNQIVAENYTALMDTGTTYFIGPVPIIETINNAIGGAPKETGGLFFVNCNKLHTFPTITFVISKVEFPIYPEDYVFKNKTDDGLECWTRFRGLERTTFILGVSFMRSYYTQFDMKHKQVGLAQAV